MAPGRSRRRWRWVCQIGGCSSGLGHGWRSVERTANGRCGGELVLLLVRLTFRIIPLLLVCIILLRLLLLMLGIIGIVLLIVLVVWLLLLLLCGVRVSSVGHLLVSLLVIITIGLMLLLFMVVVSGRGASSAANGGHFQGTTSRARRATNRGCGAGRQGTRERVGAMASRSSASTTTSSARSNGSRIMVIQKVETSLAGLILFPLAHHKDGHEEGENKGSGNTSNDGCNDRFIFAVVVILLTRVVAATTGEGGRSGPRSCPGRAGFVSGLGRLF